MTSWWLLAVAPFALAAAIVCLREPLRVALPVYTALIPFGSGLAVGSSPFGSASSLIGVLLGAGLVGQFATRHRSAPRIAVTVPIWTLFLSLAAVTALWTIDRDATVTGLGVLASLVVVFLLVTLSHADRAIVRRTETALLVGSAAAVLLGGYRLFEGGPAGERLGDGLLGPNILAVTLLVPLAIAVNRTFNPRDPGRPALNGLLAALMLAGILMTGSRTGTLGAGVVVLAMLWSMPRGARRGLAVAILAAAAVSVFVWTAHPLGIAERTFASATSSSGRLDIWQVGLAACSDYCGVGSGWGTFPDVYAETQASVPGARVLTGEGTYQPHNLWLLAIVELGVAGFVLLTAGLVATARYAVRLPPEYRSTAVGSVIGLLIGVLFLSSLEFKMFWMVLMLVSLYTNVVLAERGGPVRADLTRHHA